MPSTTECRHEERGPGDAHDDRVTQRPLGRGCPRDAIDAHMAPSSRGFMPDPSICRDMDRAATRIAEAVQARENIAIFGDYDVDGAPSAALTILLLRDPGVEAAPYRSDERRVGKDCDSPCRSRLAPSQ